MGVFWTFEGRERGIARPSRGSERLGAVLY
jgi:hypothetical protein